MASIWCVECKAESQEKDIDQLRKEAADAVKRYMNAQLGLSKKQEPPTPEVEPVEEYNEEEGEKGWSYGIDDLRDEITDMLSGWPGESLTNVYLGKRQIAVLEKAHPDLFDEDSTVCTYLGLYVSRDAAEDCIFIR